ncbi:hypothetical protein FPY71_08550 [Aureimonas fodinaquatilis]|uniref:Uncharacterized protein n=1 Tax=Aureimonas fodinaquatilis TaxID=2565783 RepID=A0A5B0DXR7_9HYPH|nr:hypothetical protein [Aureimonas fodinaquatilis]KAA0970541.1 hypothetical protein FPY71_08550 [Aureimonas fodinaquatilis]
MKSCFARRLWQGAAMAAMLVLNPAISAAQQAPASDAPAQETAPDVTVPAEVISLSPYISDVQVLGPWTDSGKSGIWRTALLVSAGQPNGNRFFVQQVEEGPSDLTVLQTTEITEIAQLNGAIVGYRADEPTPDAPSTLSIFLDIVPLDAEIAETFELFISPDAAYRFGPASN